MSFLYPIFIYLMLPIILILFFFIFTGTKKNFEMFDKDVLDRLRFESKALSQNTRYALFLMSFVFMIFALAQPVIKEGEIKIQKKSADILVGIDISDSMKAEDIYPNRLEFSKNKAISLIENAPHNRIGVLAFAKHDYIVSPLSFDHSSVAFLLSKVQTQNITEKGTHLDAMLTSSIAMLEHAKYKNLLLFTDGGDTDNFDEEISLAKENDLRIFIIGVGTKKGSPVKSKNGEFIKQGGNILISKLNPKLSELATKTGGVYIQSTLGDKDIQTMIVEIEKMTKQATLKEETIPRYTQLFYYPLMMAIFFLLLSFSSFPKRKNTISAFVLIALSMFVSPDLKAGLLDFQELQEAETAYYASDYNKSAAIYEDYALKSQEAVYNLANTYYKRGDYERAAKIYEQINKPELKTKALHNKGNALVKSKKYEDALKTYEEALKIKEDKQTRENYEAVKKFLEEQKKQDKKDKKDDKKDKKKDDKKDKKKDDKKDGDKKKDDKQKSDKEKKDKPKDDKKKSEKQKQKDKEEKKKQEAKDKKEKEEQKSEKKEQKVAVTKQEMSDLEAKKWLKMMKNSQKGHLYKMKQIEHKEDENEKPW